MTTTEEYFKIAHKWKFFKDVGNKSVDERFPNGYWSTQKFFKEKYEFLPDILDSFTQLKKWVIDPMEAEGYWLTVDKVHVMWINKEEFDLAIDDDIYTEPIFFDGDIPKAMIKSATRYWESKK